MRLFFCSCIELLPDEERRERATWEEPPEKIESDEAGIFLGSPHVFRRMDDGFLQVQDGGGFIKGFGLALIDHSLKYGDLLWCQEALLQCGLPA